MSVTGRDHGVDAARRAPSDRPPSDRLPAAADADDPPLTAPLDRAVGWAEIQRMSQSAGYRDDPYLHAIRATARARRGTRMVKVLSPTQLAGHLHGWLPYGFCYRARDIAHLRTPEQLSVLHTDDAGAGPVAYALRWRAVDPADYETPMGAVQAGLTTLPAHSRVGPLVLGTGFTPADDDLIPEFVTAGVTDLPLPANAQLVAYTSDGDEVVLYAYQPEQRGWSRLAGPRWRHLLTGLAGVNPDQEYVSAPDATSSRLFGTAGGREYEAIADPPDFRVRALTRAARRPVSTLSRRSELAEWRGTTCWVLQRDPQWARLRLTAPDADTVSAAGARCYERGVYEMWAPTAELADHRVMDLPYAI